MLKSCRTYKGQTEGHQEYVSWISFFNLANNSEQENRAPDVVLKFLYIKNSIDSIVIWLYVLSVSLYQMAAYFLNLSRLGFIPSHIQ